MPETYSELATAFTTADTVGSVEIAFVNSQLHVRFAVYGSPSQEIVFYDVRAFSWSGWEDTSPSISPDRVYSVSDSKFLAPWESCAVSQTRFTHFKLGFNAEAKYLDVIATRMEEKMADPAGTNNDRAAPGRV